MDCSLYVGTSGWMYDWNPDGFEWYLRSSGLNAVELNMSFYRFPRRSQVERWARLSRSRLRWAVKVHQSITHWSRLGGRAVELMRRFLEVFKPLDTAIDFYLLQLPPSFTRTGSSIDRLVAFVRSIGLGSRLAVEFRHSSWFSESTVDLCRELGVTVVSIDSPDATWIVASSDTVYLRLHGRTTWYAHDYSSEELRELLERALSLKPKRLYVFLNNDHWMLSNAHLVVKLGTEMGCRYAGSA
jgi:uncharacterized protein YecE (DUF72 family)